MKVGTRTTSTPVIVSIRYTGGMCTARTGGGRRSSGTQPLFFFGGLASRR